MNNKRKMRRLKKQRDRANKECNHLRKSNGVLQKESNGFRTELYEVRQKNRELETFDLYLSAMSEFYNMGRIIFLPHRRHTVNIFEERKEPVDILAKIHRSIRKVDLDMEVFQLMRSNKMIEYDFEPFNDRLVVKPTMFYMERMVETARQLSQRRLLV